MKFGLMTTIDVTEDTVDPSSTVVQQGSKMLAWLAQELPQDPSTSWLSGPVEDGGLRLRIVTSHDDVFAARAMRIKLRTMVTESQRWASMSDAMTFGIYGVYEQAEAAAGLPPSKPVPHI